MSTAYIYLLPPAFLSKLAGYFLLAAEEFQDTQSHLSQQASLPTIFDSLAIFMRSYWKNTDSCLTLILRPMLLRIQ